MKRILILGTGGTIACEPGDDGLSPNSGSGVMLELLGGLKRYYDLDYKEILNLDSSNIQMEEWSFIARHLYDALDHYDGIVITHGTDTMAYTASVLTYMLQGVHKPVILTGSQLPLIHPMSDAFSNLSLALAAVENNIAGINIAFHHRVIKGCRAVKVRTMGFDAFESVNYPYLAELSSAGLQRMSGGGDFSEISGAVEFYPDLCNDVFLLKLVPGTNPQIFDAILKMKYQGVVIEAFGVGGLQFMRRDLSEKVRKLVECGTAVVVCSQCLYETSDFSVYEVGRRVLSGGAIPGWDMTTEACITKLMWALGQTKKMDQIRRIFETSYAGEVSPPME